MVALLMLIAWQVGKPLTIEVEVGNAARAVQAISQATEIRMAASPEVGQEVVYINVKQQPAREVMSAIADATAAVWKSEPDGSLLLDRPESLRNRVMSAEWAQETKRRLADLKEWRDRLEKCLLIPYDNANLRRRVIEKSNLDSNQSESPSPSTQQMRWDRQEELRRTDPVFRALARCLAGVDLTKMAQMPPVSDLFYSTSPNANELPLPATAKDACRLLQAEQLRFGRVLAHATSSDPSSKFQTDETIKFFANSAGSASFAATTEPWTRTLPYRARPTRATLTITCYQTYAYEFHLMLRSAKNEPVLEFNLGDVNIWPKETLPGPLLIAEDRQKPTPSTATRDLWACFNRTKGGQKAITQSLKPFLIDPVNHDPLWLGNQELLHAIAQRTGKSVIACLPDSAFCPFDSSYDVANYLSGRSMIPIRRSDILELRPASFRSHWTNRTNRTNLANCGQKLLTGNKVEIRDFAKLVSGRSEAAPNVLGESILSLLDEDSYSGNAPGTFRMPFQSAFTSLLASLSEGQFAKLAHGFTIPYHELSRDQQDLARRIVFGPTVNGDEEGASEFGPTQELPQGLIQGTGLRCELIQTYNVAFHNLRPDFFTVNLAKPYTGPFDSGPPQLPKNGPGGITYVYRPSTILLLKCGLTPSHSIVGRFEGPSGPSSGRPMPFNQLPVEIQKRLKETVKGFGDLDAAPSR